MSPLSAETSTTTPSPARNPGRSLAPVVAAGAIALATVLLVVPGAAPFAPGWSVAGLVGLGLLLLSLTALVAAMPARGSGRAHRVLTLVGSVLAVAALLAVGVAVALRLFLPVADLSVLVQFSDLSGRVAIEYCPNLPSSFAASVSSADLNDSGAIVPVRVTSKICGNPEFPEGVLLYLERSSITIGDASPR